MLNLGKKKKARKKIALLNCVFGLFRTQNSGDLEVILEGYG